MKEVKAPLLVTLRMDAQAFAHFEALRQAHFPPDRNKVPAHITLFHQLPEANEASVIEDLQTVATSQQVFTLNILGLWNLGQGVAYRLESNEAQKLRLKMAECWWDWLTPQDKKRRFQPHITVQNKTTAEKARELYDVLAAEFVPHEIKDMGLDLWRYYRHWEPAGYFGFNAPSDTHNRTAITT